MRVQAPSAPGFKGFRRFRGWRLTGLRPEGCGRLMAAGYVRFRSGGDSPNGLRVVVAASPQFLKSALRDLLSVSYGMIGILQIGSLRSPPPIRLRLWTRLRREGSEGSEGSKGSEGGGSALRAQILKKRGAAGAAGCVEGLRRFAQGATAPTALRVADCPLGQ